MDLRNYRTPGEMQVPCSRCKTMLQPSVADSVALGMYVNKDESVCVTHSDPVRRYCKECWKVQKQYVYWR